MKTRARVIRQFFRKMPPKYGAVRRRGVAGGLLPHHHEPGVNVFLGQVVARQQRM